MERRRVTRELHAPVRRRYSRRRTVIKGYDDLWQADLVEMIPHAKDNRGYRYILMVIDAYSKFLWAVPVKNKTGNEVTDGMRQILQQGRVPHNLQTDHGKEFYNETFQRLMREYKINHYSTYGTTKAAIVERVNRTLKNPMWEEFSYRCNYKWLDLLPQLVKEYNARKHRTTKMAPKDVTTKTNLTVYKHIKRTAKVHFKVGDKVRVSKEKGSFAKGYLPNWTTEIFTVDKVQRTNPTTYLLKDYRNEPVLGAFYREEMQKTKYPDFYLVEKVLRRRGKKAFVKWLGFSNEHNSWVDVNAISDAPK